MAVTAGLRGERPRVVVLRPLGLGDLCTAIPALRAVRSAWPHADLLLAAPAWQTPLARMVGVDRVIDTPERGPLAADLHGPDVAVNLHGRGPESTERALLLEPSRLVAFRHETIAATTGMPEWRAGEHEVDRWCRLLTGARIPVNPLDRRLPVVADAGSPFRGAVLIHPGAGAPGRRWPAARFATVASALACAGHRVVLVGTDAEAALCTAIARASGDEGRVTSVAGDTDLLGLARLLAGACLLVANDSGVAHLAVATGTPSVVLFGPTPPAEWGPPDSPRHRAIWKGRTGNPHASDLDAGLSAITTAEVLDAARCVLAAARPSPAHRR